MGAGSNGVIFDDLSDPNPGFKVAVYLQVEYLKNGAYRDKLTKEHQWETIHNLSNDTHFQGRNHWGVGGGGGGGVRTPQLS